MDDAPRPSFDDALARLARLERELAAINREVAEIRGAFGAAGAERVEKARTSSPAPRRTFGFLADARAAASGVISSDRLESLVGRYGTLLLAALVILMGVGVLIQVAVVRGLLTPAVRVGFGALVAAAVGGAGLYFHRRGEIRYGNVLLALSLAIVDLVAWGAGPRMHLVPTGAALAVVDVVAVALAALAMRDESEFLFCVAVAGALSAPFVTSDGRGTAPALLAYGALVIIGSMPAVRDPRWRRAFAVLVGAAFGYVLMAASMPMVAGWYAPYAIVLFSGVCALGALLLAEEEWRGNLARSFLGVGLIGVPAGWDRMITSPTGITWTIALGFAGVTYVALRDRHRPQPQWRESALALPWLSLAVAATTTHTGITRAGVFAIWTLFALAAWQLERRDGEHERGGAHLLAGGLLGGIAVAVLLWDYPLALVAGLATWGVILSVPTSREGTLLPLTGVAVVLLGAALSAIDQLASRPAYSYVPFTSRSSASALCATLGLAAASEVLSRGDGAPARWSDRPVRLAIVIGFVILWGRMEVAQAFNRDLASFLLIAYYAACGLASILVGRKLGIQRLRVAGLALAIYAALKAVVNASEITGVMLRVGAYGAVGVFLLGAGYLYRERRGELEASQRAAEAV